MAGETTAALLENVTKGIRSSVSRTLETSVKAAWDRGAWEVQWWQQATRKEQEVWRWKNTEGQRVP